ncbi:hypothetical protein BJX63DRAFT_428146 [Aspergillus granulosus]|uniref:BZIP domain-containing protein n=1 Tax=Aspergillus granulosus TaxID=176169 RepID=A0ABR4HXT9_9EURO
MTDNQPHWRKPNTEKRKLQNKIASQNYRRRRREKLALFDRLHHLLTTEVGASTALAASDLLIPEEDVGPSLTDGNEPIAAASDHGTAIEPHGTSFALPSGGPAPQNLHAGLATSTSTICPVDLGLTGSFTQAHPTHDPVNSIFDPLHPPHFDDEVGLHTISNAQHPDHRSRVIASLPFLSLAEKRHLVGLLNTEIKSELENSHPDLVMDLSPSFLTDYSSPTTTPSRQGRKPLTRPSQSLFIHTEVTRYERWLRRHILSHPHLPDPRMNAIRIQHSSFYAAILANSRAILLVNNEVLQEDGLSPYSVDHVTGHKPDQIASARAAFDGLIPQDLRPTDQQLMHPHHPYIDVIPFPSFRHRMMAAVTADPPLIDEDEMCADMNAEAFICWGGMGRVHGTRTTGGSWEAEGYGDMAAEVPWDMRSWEPQVWFLRKYWFLVGGWDDEMWRNARWWAALRGETIRFR